MKIGTFASALAIQVGVCGFGVISARSAELISIATVNNPDMIVMESLSSHFEDANPGIKPKWVTMEENVLRQRVTTDIATHSGQLDVMTVRLHEVPIWSKLGCLTAFDDIPASYAADDVFKSLRDGLTYKGQLYSLPFYGESTFTIYRTDLFKTAGLSMPEKPTWSQVEQLAAKINDPAHGVYGLCLRGKPGWGENMGALSEIVNSFGGRYFDMKWKSQLTSPAWVKAVSFYVDVLKKYGPPGEVTSGHNENLALFASGRCGMWVDATVSASYLADPEQSQIAGKVGYAQAPYETTKAGSNYLWSWTLAIPKTTQHLEAAKKFVYWATSPDYIKLVAQQRGWKAVPPGTRVSTYRSPHYLQAARFAPVMLKAIEAADLNHPTAEPVPYTGISYVAIPQWRAIGTDVGQTIAGALTGQQSVLAALQRAQSAMQRMMAEAGYYK